MSKNDSATTWIATIAATAATAVSGSMATDTDSRWYRGIDKPSWQPPGIVFPFVWTALYAGLAATSARALQRLDAEGDTEAAGGYQAALAANLVLNQGWSWVFFRAHSLGPATGVAALLAASCWDLVRRAAKTEGRFGAELAPYAVWCSFATVLTGSIWRRNRG